MEIDNGVNTGQIHVENMFWPGQGIEPLDFLTGSDITLSTYHYTLNGTAGNDTLHGVQYSGGANDTINGGAGNDTIHGYEGANTINGGDGNDLVIAGGGNDTIDGGDGNDTITGGGGTNSLTGGAGDDKITGAGNDTYYYTSGNDVYSESYGTDSIVLPAAYTQANTVYYTIGNTLKIVFGTDGLNSILIDSFYYGGGSIETLDFYTGTDVTLSYKAANDNVERCPVRWRVAA